MDLYAFISRSSNGLLSDQVKRYTFQILRGLEYLDSINIIVVI